ncbi:hypothetical protein FOCC_FOCC002788 [Frankliniella occidentalis]|nr:hypothetical protein FOCC_FOCC002788 [Frankliniella occidentalis]
MPFLKKFKACPEWKRKEQITYKSGSRHTVYFLNGDRHVGDWLNNRKEGKGAELTRNGYLYEGDFSDELRHGHGVLSKQMEDGSLRLVYSGEWQRGKRHVGVARGTLEAPNGEVFTQSRHPARSQGWGIGRGADGTWYEGCWQAGRRAGEGRVWLPDGAFYHGEWMDDKFHGHGILVQRKT